MIVCTLQFCYPSLSEISSVLYSHKTGPSIITYNHSPLSSYLYPTAIPIATRRIQESIHNIQLSLRSFCSLPVQDLLSHLWANLSFSTRSSAVINAIKLIDLCFACLRALISSDLPQPSRSQPLPWHNDDHRSAMTIIRPPFRDARNGIIFLFLHRRSCYTSF